MGSCPLADSGVDSRAVTSEAAAAIGAAGGIRWTICMRRLSWDGMDAVLTLYVEPGQQNRQRVARAPPDRGGTAWQSGTAWPMSTTWRTRTSRGLLWTAVAEYRAGYEWSCRAGRRRVRAMAGVRRPVPSLLNRMRQGRARPGRRTAVKLLVCRS